MFQFLYGIVGHQLLHVWDLFCIVLLIVIAVIAGVHVWKQKQREDDFEDRLEEEATKE